MKKGKEKLHKERSKGIFLGYKLTFSPVSPVRTRIRNSACPPVLPVVDTAVGLRTVGVGPAAHHAHLVEADMAQETVVIHPTRY